MSDRETEQRKYQVIFINWFDRSEDRILYETDNDWEKQLGEESIINLLDKHAIELDAADLIGKGVSIYFCEDLGVYDNGDDDRDDEDLIIKREGKDHLFRIIDCSGDFPLIEGSFSHGIYLEGNELKYFELRDLQDVTRLFCRFLINPIEIELCKIICHENRIETQYLADNTIDTEIKRFPLNFFDVYCLFCRQAVITHKIRAEDYPQCIEIDNPCLHYIGKAVKTYDRYLKESLKDIGITYKIDGEDLYIEISAGWRKLFVYDPPYEPEKFFYGDNQDYYRDVFLFLDA